jgi:hypothetical protein
VVSRLQREARVVASPLEIRKVTTGALLCRLARGCQRKGVALSKAHHDADPPHPVEELRKYREQPRRPAADECDELAPPSEDFTLPHRRRITHPTALLKNPCCAPRHFGPLDFVFLVPSEVEGDWKR